MSDIATLENKLLDTQIACTMEAMASRIAHIQTRNRNHDARSKRMQAIALSLEELSKEDNKDAEWAVVARAKCIAALHEIGSDVTRQWAKEMEANA